MRAGVKPLKKRKRHAVGYYTHLRGEHMSFNEADTRAKLIDPAIHKSGWTEDLLRREETAGTVEIIIGMIEALPAVLLRRAFSGEI